MLYQHGALILKTTLIASADFSIDANNIAKKISEKKLKLKPSAAAINPLTGDVWILASVKSIIDCY